jgi:hypothetical protein
MNNKRKMKKKSEETKRFLMTFLNGFEINIPNMLLTRLMAVTSYCLLIIRLNINT